MIIIFVELLNSFIFLIVMQFFIVLHVLCGSILLLEYVRIVFMLDPNYLVLQYASIIL